MKSYTPIDLERRSFTGLRCAVLSVTALAVGGSLYALIATGFNPWLTGFLLLPMAC